MKCNVFKKKINQIKKDKSKLKNLHRKIQNLPKTLILKSFISFKAFLMISRQQIEQNVYNDLRSYQKPNFASFSLQKYKMRHKIFWLNKASDFLSKNSF